jgi:hypothetical protein
LISRVPALSQPDYSLSLEAEHKLPWQLQEGANRRHKRHIQYSPLQEIPRLLQRLCQTSVKTMIEAENLIKITQITLFLWSNGIAMNTIKHR